MSNVLHIYRMTYKTYDMQEYIFVHPEERFARKPLFGIFCFILSRLATSSTLISNLLTLSVQTAPFCVSLCFAFWFSALTFATLMCVLRQNEVRYWLYWWISVVTSKEMVAAPPHSACRCWLQTTLCCSDGNWWVVNDNWKSSVRLARYVSRRWTQVNHWWSIVSKVSKSHQNQGLLYILG